MSRYRAPASAPRQKKHNGDVHNTGQPTRHAAQFTRGLSPAALRSLFWASHTVGVVTCSTVRDDSLITTIRSLYRNTRLGRSLFSRGERTGWHHFESN
jgi:hypothetical protein